MANDITKLLSGNAYPGRGLMMGLAPDGQRLVALYFIMGRSENSRNRVFYQENGLLRIGFHDMRLIKDASLISYHPMARVDQALILTNGDQTDTITDALHEGGSFESALRTRAFEPDAPLFTPRISGLANIETGAYQLSILKSGDAEGRSCQRFFFDYEPLPGQGHLIHTYQQDGNPPPSYQGKPAAINIPADLSGFAEQVWQSLDSNNRVALCLLEQELSGGSPKLIIFNRHTV